MNCSNILALHKQSLNKVIVLHVNHSQELGQQAQESIAKLKSIELTLLNQSVILKNINDDTNTLVTLSNRLHDLGILPYYLHVMDKVQNASHFDIPLKKAQAIHKAMQAQLPGYLVPKLSAEIAGENSKTWVNC